MKMKPADVVMSVELLFLLSWAIGSDLAGAIIAPWLWFQGLTIIGVISTGLVAGLHRHPQIVESIKEKEVWDATAILFAAATVIVLSAKGHFALAAVSLVASVVFRSFVWAVKKA